MHFKRRIDACRCQSGVAPRIFVYDLKNRGLSSAERRNPHYTLTKSLDLQDCHKHGRRHVGGRVGNRPPWKKSGWAMPTLEILTVV